MKDNNTVQRDERTLEHRFGKVKITHIPDKIVDDDEVRPDRGRAQVRRALQGQRGKPSVRPSHRDETYSMRRRLGRQPYQVPTAILGVPTAREEWGAHRHIGAVRRL